MAPPRLETVEVLWDNPPGPKQGVTIVRRYRGHAYERHIKPGHYVTQGDTAHLLGVSRMTVHRWVRAGVLKERQRNGVSHILMRDVRRLARERGALATAGHFLTG